jgi:hypothetical protein
MHPAYRLQRNSALAGLQDHLDGRKTGQSTALSGIVVGNRCGGVHARHCAAAGNDENSKVVWDARPGHLHDGHTGPIVTLRAGWLVAVVTLEEANLKVGYQLAGDGA